MNNWDQTPPQASDSGMRISVHERLARLETTSTAIHDDVRLIKNAVLGDGQQTGLMTRVDRLEQASDRQKTTMKVLMGGVVGIIGKWVLGLLGVPGQP